MSDLVPRTATHRAIVTTAWAAAGVVAVSSVAMGWGALGGAGGVLNTATRGERTTVVLDAVTSVAVTTDAVDVLWGTDMTQTITLKPGWNAIHVALDGATLRCRDEAEAGAGSSPGLSLATLRDIDETLRDIDLGNAPVHIFAGASAAWAAAPVRQTTATRARESADRMVFPPGARGRRLTTPSVRRCIV